MLRRVSAFLVVAVPAAALACASATSEGGGDSAPRSYSNIINRAELETVGVRNLYEAVQRLRPRWLQVQAARSFNMESGVVVYQDQMLLGGVEVLEGLGVEGIYEIRYLDGSMAKNTLPGIGDRHVDGAIILYYSPP